MADELIERRKRLMYRSLYTGTKETDLILGGFAQRHLEELTNEQLDTYETLLSIEDPRLYTWITRQETPLPGFDTDVLAMIQNFSLTNKGDS